ncbi:MAG: hypothetical protein JO246_06605, partial [Frankiaceae bacterium]|nr:hypothetical protein [Frankiaceae bacterium]
MSLALELDVVADRWTGGAGMTHGGRFHALTVSRIVPETADAVSIVFDIPGDLADRYA